MKIIAYGSLLNAQSLEKTLGRKSKLIPIEVKCVKRIFDAPFDGYAFLNLELDKNSSIDAAYFELNKNEIEKFAKREAGSVLYEIEKGLFFFQWQKNTNAHLPVLQSYINVCADGASALDIDFWKGTVEPSIIIDDLLDPQYP
jgi:hypothetical protein